MAIEFDGAATGSALIMCGSHASIGDVWDGGGSFAAWVYNHDITVEGRALWIKSIWGINYINLIDVGGTDYLYFHQDFSGTDGNWRIAAPALNAWVHIAVTYNADAVTNDPNIYFNGVLQSEAEVTTPTGTRDTDAADIGMVGGTSTGTDNLDGLMEDARLFGRIISVEEVALLVAGYRGPLGGEVMWLDMERAWGVGHWDGMTLVENVNVLPDGSVNENTGNPKFNPVARASDCPRMG